MNIESTEPVIEVKGLSKRYLISHEQKAEYGSLRDAVTGFVKRPFEKNHQSLGGHEKKEEFWALNDVSFNVNKGEIFGVIGRNGSGKSTLLKILSRIVTPTDGSVIIRGRTASLLEVGTGFHPELTGRENIFFNGSMLGMSRDEIGKKFDEIVHFAEIEKFLDTPVKFYSSGMYVRLAFSVAAHLEPDVLILDEVLAVGDERFQQKSMKKILETMQSGTTVLFVSHSMASIQKLCNRGILLNKGEVEFIGGVEQLTRLYHSMMVEDTSESTSIVWCWKNGDIVLNDYFIPLDIHLEYASGKVVDSPVGNDVAVRVVINGDCLRSTSDLTIGIGVYNSSRQLMYFSYPSDVAERARVTIPKGRVKLVCQLPTHFLNADTYTILLVGSIHNKEWLYEPEGNNPHINYIVSGGLSKSFYWKKKREGIMAPILDWEVVND